MVRRRPEFTLQAAVVEHLSKATVPGVLWFAVPNGELRTKRTAGKLKAMGVVAGIPDLVFIIDGRAHGLELKATKGRQNDAQLFIERAWQAAGGVYRVGMGWDEVQAILREWGVFRESYSHTPARRSQLSLNIPEAA